MYIPTAFAETDTVALHEFMRRYSFAVLISHGNEGLLANHVPLLLDVEGAPQGVLLGHMARANPQWDQVEGEVMAVFSGPHAYVSPAWYGEAETVPTWNYVAVHAHGTFHVIEDKDILLSILRRSVQFYESRRESPWDFVDSAPHIDRLLEAIVGFRVVIKRLEGKRKLSQNHTEVRRRRVIQALAGQPDDDSQAIARLMAEDLDRPVDPART